MGSREREEGGVGGGGLSREMDFHAPPGQKTKAVQSNVSIFPPKQRARAARRGSRLISVSRDQEAPSVRSLAASSHTAGV